jgi:RNA polymerase sigma-70 factor (ECF subfamily)
VCQEVFTAVYRKASAFRAQAQFSTWLHRIAVNAALKARGRRKRSAEEPSGGLPEAASAAEATAAFESDEMVLKLLRPLPDKLRAAVVLREVGGWSYEEIASILKCNRGTVEQRLHRGMNLLREIWQGRLTR